MKGKGKYTFHLLVSTFVLATCSIHASSSDEVTESDKAEVSFLWFIENYSYCWHKNGETLNSPLFTAKWLKGTSWHLSLNPRGFDKENEGYISLYLVRSLFDEFPETFHVKYELSIEAENGSAIISNEYDWTFGKGQRYGHGGFLDMDSVRKTDLLKDTLSVRCRIWIGEGSIQEMEQTSARTRIGIENVSFLIVVEGFSALQPFQNKIEAFSSSLYFSDDLVGGGKIIVEIHPSEGNQTLARCKISLVDLNENLIPCGEADNRFDATRKNIQTLPLSLSKQAILNRKSEFLPGDKLSLLWHGVFSTGIEYQKIESTLHEIPFMVSKHKNEDDHKKDKYIAAEKLSVCSGALDNLQEIYSNQFFTDVELETKTKSFPAHKIILCSRSAVFNATLSNNLTISVIHVDDLEDDTVQQFLFFLYSDKLENLDWESAMKLYHAADKYIIEKLKVMCSSYLIEKLNTSSVSEVLLLADNHNDSDLKLAVEDFIFENAEQVFQSEEWKKLMETNPILARKTMLLKYTRKV